MAGGKEGGLIGGEVKSKKGQGGRLYASLWKLSLFCLGPGGDEWSLPEFRSYAGEWGERRKGIDFSTICSYCCYPKRLNKVIKTITLGDVWTPGAHS